MQLTINDSTSRRLVAYCDRAGLVPDHFASATLAARLDALGVPEIDPAVPVPRDVPDTDRLPRSAW